LSLTNLFNRLIFKGTDPTIVAKGYDEVHEFEVEEITAKQFPHGIGNFFIGGKILEKIQLITFKKGLLKIK
jgi:hypothetical protein